MPQETSHYTVLARRFRPQQFDDVVGQQHVAQSLQNAIKADRVAHAYLFTGARGVGKTSMARILAKALNCPNAIDAVPCNSCEICDGISSGNDVDILEIDGASNRGIDDIRSLRANVGVKSMRTRYKVYIVDEVHMLTRDAFNALLKTLEEPPPGVKFVFCTTEPNKIPDTILSRCQRFDFSSINTQRIAERLAEIAVAEGVEVEPAAIDLVARRAAGSMRDSQSLFDQLLAFGGEKLTAADVHRLLGTAGDDRLLALFTAIVKRDPAEALAEVDRAIESGVQPGELVNQLLGCGRDLMVLSAGAGSLELIGVSEANRAGLVDLGQAWGLETIIAAMQILGDTRDRLMRTTQSRALVELAVARLAVLEDLTSISALLAGADPKPAQKKTGNDARPKLTEPAPTDSDSAPTEPAVVAPPAANPPAPSAAPSADNPATTAPAASQPRREPTTSPPAASAEPEQPPAVASAVSEPREVTLAAAAQDRPVDVLSDPAPAGNDPVAAPPIPPTAEEPVPVDSMSAVPGVDPLADAAEEPEDEESDLQIIELESGNESSFHAQLVDCLKDTASDHLRTASLAISGPNQVALTFSSNYHFSKQYCERPEVLSRLQREASRVAGKRVQIRIDLAEDVAESSRPAAAAKQQQKPVSPEDDAFVQEAVAIFRATVVRSERH